jgi:hypothetical protein
MNSNEYTTRTFGRTEDGRIAPYVLARLAEVADPDDRYSVGALFLGQVFEYWEERVAEDDDRGTDEGRASIVRDCSTIHEGMAEVDCWRVFADLALWRDDAIEVWAWHTVPNVVDLVSASETVDRLTEAVPTIARRSVEFVAGRLAETLTDALLKIEGKR